jgi:hypothetical protein
MVAGAKTKIGPDYVLLVSQLIRPAEGTWGVVFEDFYYHNFESYALSALAFLNKPLLSVYIVFHPKWQINYVTHKLKPKPRAKGRQLTFASLREHCRFTHLRTAVSSASEAAPRCRRP